MEHSIFGHFVFYYGWKAHYEISLYGNIFSILIDLEADKETDSITSEQKFAMETFHANQAQQLKTAELLLADYANHIDESSRFVPTAVYFDRNGSYALLCEDTQDTDVGVAVLLWPETAVLSQDEFL